MSEELRPSLPSLPTMSMFDPDMMEQHACGITVFATSVITYAPELIIRPWQGTRYIKPITGILGLLVFTTVCYASIILSAFQGHGYSPLAALFVFWGLFIRQAIRHGRLMNHKELEIDSELDNPGWRPTKSWLKMRAVYEPLAFLSIIFALWAIGLLNTFLMLYLVFCAFCLSLKSFVMWYQRHVYIRIKLDMLSRIPKLEKEVTPDEMPQVTRHRIAAA